MEKQINKKKGKEIPRITRKSTLTNKWTYGVVLLILILTACIYYLPNIQGNSLPAHDYQQGISMSHQLQTELTATGKTSNWAPNLFSGMPSYQIWKTYKNIGSWITEGAKSFISPYLYIGLIAVFSSFFLLYFMNLHPLIVFIGGVSILLSNFTIISLMAGHNNKVMVLSVVPLTLAGIWALYEQRKYLLGLFVISLSMALQIRMNHIQITYFMMFLIGFWTLFDMAKWIGKMEFKHLFLSLIFLLLGMTIGVATNS
ncbi:MAG: hypothetical protein M9887_09835, partial [Chitinophagales bacterium]|nr:hypothetical protein [Chitinophagales bacterium]